MADLQVGDAAPDFTLAADDGRTLRLADFAGRKLVLYFYPKDDTSGCTKEAIDFSGLLPRFEAAGAAIVGVSKEGASSKAKFRAKHDLTVGLGADESGVTEAYGAWVQKSMYGRTYMGIDRSTFLIGPDGRIAEIWRKVKVPGHAEAVLKAVEALG
jgi:peroxiredoxin Q/BCP